MICSSKSQKAHQILSFLASKAQIEKMSMDSTSSFPFTDASEDGGEQHPPSFYCPISTEVMHDPVVLSDGHSYERRHIETWLGDRNTSPKTGAVLPSNFMFPNHALRNSIEEYFSVGAHAYFRFFF